VDKKPLLIIGAGGHAKVIIDLVEREDRYSIIGLLDDDPALHGQNFFGYRVLGGRDVLHQDELSDCLCLVAIGVNRIRQKIGEDLAGKGRLFSQSCHPSVQVSRGATLGPGSVAMAGVIVNADSSIGQHVIINTAASIDHDCIIGDFVHLAPGSTLCGGVRVGDGSFIGAGATVAPWVTIGKNVTVGAGATVIRDVSDGDTVVGTPARTTSTKSA
jgi:sugar O-acyltransferase (sialic acid O-acetyltransferase NeuD family)